VATKKTPAKKPAKEKRAPKSGASSKATSPQKKRGKNGEAYEGGDKSRPFKYPTGKRASILARGAPTTCSKEIADEVAKHIRRGNYFETACQLAGVPKSTAFNWMKLAKVSGEKPDPVHVYFLDSVKLAEAEAEDRDLRRIDRIADVNWQAAAWRLERRNWERWGRKDRLDMQSQLSGGMELNVTQVTGDERKQRIDELLKRIEMLKSQQVAAARVHGAESGLGQSGLEDEIEPD
jgi:hypothetical protein